MTNVVVADKYGEILHGEPNRLQDLIIWSTVVWDLKGIWGNESFEDTCNRTRTILKKMGDLSTRSREQNRKLFEVLASEQIERVKCQRKRKKKN